MPRGKTITREPKPSKPHGAPAAVSKARAALLTQQAERVRLRNAQSTGDLVSASEVEKEWQGIMRLVRSRLLAVAQRHPAADQAIRQALSELAKGKPLRAPARQPGCCTKKNKRQGSNRKAWRKAEPGASALTG